MRKLSQRVKVPRFARTVEIIVNIPDAPQPTPAHAPPPEPSWWSRAKGAGKVLGGTIVGLTSIAAIIVASMALSEQTSADLEQQQVNEAQAAASQRQQVSQVTYVQEGSQVPRVPVVMENLGTSPAYSPILIIQFEGWVYPYGRKGAKFYPVVGTFSIILNNMPACSSSTVNLGPIIVHDIEIDKSMWPPEVPLKLTELESPTLGASVTGMLFGDGSGRIWQYSAGDGLQVVPSVQEAEEEDGLELSTSGYLTATYKSTSGCT